MNDAVLAIMALSGLGIMVIAFGSFVWMFFTALVNALKEDAHKKEMKRINAVIKSIESNKGEMR